MRTSTRKPSRQDDRAAEESANRRLDRFILTGIVALAVVLRLFRLGKTALWIDEWGVLAFSDGNRNPVEIVFTILRTCFEGPTNEHMPFQYAWLNLFLRLYAALGIAPTAALLRLPFAALGVLCVLAFWCAVAHWRTRRVAHWAAFLVTISFFHVYQSRDATSYAPLMFFAALHLIGTAAYVQRRSVNKRHRLAFVLGAAGMLLTHMTAWMFLFVEGVLLLARALVEIRRMGGPWRRHLWGGALEPAWLLLASALPFTITLYRAVAHYQPPSLKEDVAIARPTVDFFSYQMAHFGWGWGRGRLIGFIALLVGGVAAGVLNRERRTGTAACLAMVIAPAVLLFIAPHGVLFPRYLTVCFLPLVALAAEGAEWWSERIAQLHPGKKLTSFFAPLLIVLLAVTSNALSHWVLWRLQAKLMPIPQLVKWIEDNVPEDGLYVWQSGFNLREIPQTYPVRNRHAAWATMHSGSIKEPEAAARWAPFARDIFRRFPRAVLLATDFPEPPSNGPWAWLGTDFARRETIRNPEMEILHSLGLSPHGLIYPSNLNVVCYYNRPEDLLRSADRNNLRAWPEGKGWQFLQTRDGLLFASPDPSGSVAVPNGVGQPIRVNLIFEGYAQATGQMLVRGPDGQTLTRTVQAGNQVNEVVGPFLVPEGWHHAKVEFWPTGKAGLLLYAVRPEWVENVLGEK